jgi:hypothetical protein
MTEKEKAKELVDKFMSIKNVKLSDNSFIEWPTARQCAIYATEECLSTCTESMIYYWMEVKRIIEEEL